ncbi:MAG: V-type ATP synthase subunit D [Christensenellaceae bacterium]
MALLNVNPTRMELTRLKKALAVARKGHKLLKDKRDELMRQFLELIREAKELRKGVERKLEIANASFAVAGSLMQSEALISALMLPRQDVELRVATKNVMSVNVPRFKAEFRSTDMSDAFSYGYAFTSGELDTAISNLNDALPDMLHLAEVEKSVQLISADIEKTRRRVNALEYVMIPDYEDTIRYIAMKLEENERGSLTRLMKVKDMILEASLRAKKQME